MDLAYVINKLVATGFLTLRDQGTILASENRDTNVERRLDALELKNDGAFSAFLKALADFRQQLHATLFEDEC